MIGLVLDSLFSGPMMLLGAGAGVLAIFGCIACMRCRMRDCTCIRKCLRCIGVDKFDDFEMMMMVHEASFTASAGKQTTSIRVTAGREVVETDTNSKSNFQQPLTVFVEQGTSKIHVDLLDSSKGVLAKLIFDSLNDVINGNPSTMRDKMHSMKQCSKGIMNPKVKLTMVVNSGDDLEAPLLSGVSHEVDFLVRQQLQKDQKPGDHQLSEMEMISGGCRGPLDLFEGMGKTNAVFVDVCGPPKTKHWTLKVYDDEHKCEKGKDFLHEVDLLKVQSVQPDPGRSNVFVVTYFAKESGIRTSTKLTFRRIDRARDVWVEMLQLLVTKVHEEHSEKKDKKTNKGKH